MHEAIATTRCWCYVAKAIGNMQYIHVQDLRFVGSILLIGLGRQQEGTKEGKRGGKVEGQSLIG